jgi:hypothetical protein
MMEAARTSETMVNFYQATGRYNPEDSHLFISVLHRQGGEIKGDEVGGACSRHGKKI